MGEPHHRDGAERPCDESNRPAIAQHYIKSPQIPEGVLNRLEAGIRAFDPCLSCSTHAVGMMPLHVTLIDRNGALCDEAWKD